MDDMGKSAGKAGARLWCKLTQYMAVTAICLLPASVIAIEASGEVAAAAELAGPDRGERLLAKARAEGKLNLYATMGQEQIGVLAAEFEKKYRDRKSVV